MDPQTRRNGFIVHGLRRDHGELLPIVSRIILPRERGRTGEFTGYFSNRARNSFASASKASAPVAEAS
jgi:hypothetical protein